MKAEDRRLLKILLTDTRVASLAVLVDGAPYAGLVPFTVTPDFGTVLVHTSDLARHSPGLYDGTTFGLLVHAPDRPESDPLQLPRVSLTGRVERLPRGEQAYLEAQDIFLVKFPSSRPLFNFGDFNLYALNIDSGRFIAGFGRAYNIFPGTLAALRSP